MKIFLKSLFISSLVAFLCACTNVAMTSASAVYNRHGIEKNLHDQYLTMKSFKALHIKSDEFKDANISVATFNNEILLAGQVPDQRQKEKAEEIVKKIAANSMVYNQIKVGSPSSNLTKLSDAWITSKIKAKILASEEVEGSQIKVVTENGTVYLMGTLLPQEADAAVALARTTDGVESVVRIFSYIKISKNRAEA